MFAKVFGQIFDSSIAEDYNCRRMFIDLLVLADSDGVVDMTPEAISRRTNVPMDEVIRYIEELSKPDPLSRSKVADGRRIVLVDKSREWGWKIVNYRHYRKIKDEEARRSYFRDKQREYRAKKREAEKKESTEEEGEAGISTPLNSITSVKLLSNTVQNKFGEWMKFRRNKKKCKDFNTLFEEQAKWLSKFSADEQMEILSQSIRNDWQGLFEPKTIGNGASKKKEGRDPYELMSDKLWQSKHGNA